MRSGNCIEKILLISSVMLFFGQGGGDEMLFAVWSLGEILFLVLLHSLLRFDFGMGGERTVT